MLESKELAAIFKILYSGASFSMQKVSRFRVSSGTVISKIEKEKCEYPYYRQLSGTKIPLNFCLYSDI